MKKTLHSSFLFVVLIALISPIFSQTDDKQRIAILDFTNSGGLSEQETITLANRLRSMLVQSDAYIVLERGKMEEILEEQGFQQSGCTTTECAVEMGQLLNVQKMVSGSFGKLGETYTIDLSLIDVETAEIQQSFFRDYKGAIDGLLEIIQSIASQISNTPDNAGKQIFKLSINSDPQGARILLNGKYAGTTPYQTNARLGVELRLWLQKDNYQDWEQLLTVQKDTEIEAQLEEVAGKAGSGISSAWYWVGGGVLVGGAAILMLSGSDGGGGSVTNDFPTPPARPN